MRIAGWNTSSIFKRYAIVDQADVKRALRQLEPKLADAGGAIP